MKDLEIQIIKELIYFYSSYILYGKKKVKELAKEIESKYLNTSPIISPEIYNLIANLDEFYAPIKSKLPDYKESLNIIKKLIQKLEDYEKCKKN